MAADRYRDVGLAGNPFTAQALPAAADFDHEKHFVCRGLPAPPPPGSKTLVQVIGVSGMGKSTQLQRWRCDVPGPFHYIPRTPYRQRWSRPPTPPLNRPLVYGDEIDRMPAPLRLGWFGRLARLNATVVIGTHDDLAWIGRRCGFSVVTHVLEPFDIQLLRKLTERRMNSHSIGQAERLRLADDELAQVLLDADGVPGKAEVALHRAVAHRVRGDGQRRGDEIASGEVCDDVRSV